MPMETGREYGCDCAFIHHSTTKLPVPSCTAAAGMLRMLEAEPEKKRLPLAPGGADALHDTPVAVAVTPLPLESAKGAVLLAAVSWTSVPGTHATGSAIDGSRG